MPDSNRHLPGKLNNTLPVLVAFAAFAEGKFDVIDSAIESENHLAIGQVMIDQVTHRFGTAPKVPGLGFVRAPVVLCAGA